MLDIFIIISKGKNNSYARDLSNERHTNKTERRNRVRMCHGVKSKCQLNCLIYGRVMLLISLPRRRFRGARTSSPKNACVGG